MSFGWKVWSAGLAASAAVHAALAVYLAAPEVRDTGASGPLATISGSLSSVLGGVAQLRPVHPEPLRPVASAKIERVAPHAASPAPVRARPVEPVRAGAPIAVPVRPEPAITASAAPVVPGAATQALPEIPATPLRPAEQPGAGAVVLPAKRPAQPAGDEHPPPSEARRQAVQKQFLDQRTRAQDRGTQDRRARSVERRRERADRPASRAGSEAVGAAGATRGGGGRAAGASVGAVQSYGARVRARILANRPSAGGSGRAVVTFGLSAAGRLTYARLARSSGNAALDGAALAAVRRSSPFPAPPAGATAGQLKFLILFDFR